VKRSDSVQTILVVDDNDGIREIVRFELELLGYRVTEAVNGLEAVEVARTECPSLILMDISMPVLDGLAATRLIRQIGDICNVIIVAFSALSISDARESALAAGCNDFVRKPVDFDQLSALVNRHVPAG
jgi:CheY-like chemotaxis protein